MSADNKVFILSDGASGEGKNGKVIMINTCVEIAKHYDYTMTNLEPIQYVDSLFWKINSKLIEASQERRKQLYGTIIIDVIDKSALTVTTIEDSSAFFFSNNTIKRIAKNNKRLKI